MNRTLLLKTVRDLRKSWAQSAALVFIAALGVASFIALVGAYRDLDTSYAHTYEQLKFADVTFAVTEAPPDVVNEIAGVDGVAAVTGRTIVDTGFELANGDQIRARLIGLPAGTQPAVNQVYLESGDYLPAGAGRVALVESHFAGIHDVGPGDTVTPIVDGETVAFDVAGVAASPEYLIVSPSQQEILPTASTFAVLFVPQSTLQELAGMTNVVNNIAVRLTPGADQAQVTASIQSILEPYELESTTPRDEQPSNAALQLDLEGYKEISNLMPALILLVAAGSVYMMLGRMVRSQQPQIGLMKALGYRNRAVHGHYLAFSLLIGSIGLILGVALGIPLVRAITGGYAKELGIPLVETRLYPDLIGQSVALSLVLFTLAGWGPARSSAKLTPAGAMRLDPSTALVDGRKSLVERLVTVPLALRLPLRNVFRMRRRSLTTGLGIIFAFILILMVWGMIDSMNYLLEHNFQDVERWDVSAIFDQPQTEDTLTTVRGWDGVKSVEPIAQVPATVKVNGQEEDVLLTGLAPGQQMHVLQLGTGNTPAAALADGHVVLGEGIAESLDVRQGDTVTVDTPLGTRDLTVSGTTDELMSTVAYVSLDEVQSLVPLPGAVFNGLYLTVDTGQATAIKDKLYHLPGASSVQLKSAFRQDMEELMGLFYVFMGVMMVFALGMAFALLFNAMTVNVLERERELATMRAVGTGRGDIALQMTLENVILWLLTLVPGLLLGYWVAVQMGKAFSAELFRFKIVISPASYAITALGILVTMILAAWPAIRRVNRLNLAEATKVLT